MSALYQLPVIYLSVMYYLYETPDVLIVLGGNKKRKKKGKMRKDVDREKMEQMRTTRGWYKNKWGKACTKCNTVSVSIAGTVCISYKVPYCDMRLWAVSWHYVSSVNQWHSNQNVFVSDSRLHSTGSQPFCLMCRLCYVWECCSPFSRLIILGGNNPSVPHNMGPYAVKYHINGYLWLKCAM